MTKKNNDNVIRFNPNPSREEAMRAVKTLIAWAGDNPDREGLIETPKRVVKAYEEFFEGYKIDPTEILSKTFEEVEGYDEMVLIKTLDLNLIVNTILSQFLVKPTLLICLKKELLELVKLQD